MGQPQTLRRLNRQQVLRALLDTQGLTRPQLAGQLGLSKVTVNAVVRELLEGGLVQLWAQPAGGSGRVPQGVRLSPAVGTALGLDLQPHGLQGHAVPLAGGHEQAYRRASAPGGVVEAAAALLREVHARAPFGPLGTVVLGVPAPVDARGRVGEPNALESFDASPVLAAARELRLELRFENDANLVALALAAHGSTLATVIERPSGLGVGLLLQGQLYRGPQGRAGELGQAPWPTAQGARCIERLPVAERTEAAAYALAGLSTALDLERLILIGDQAPTLAARLRELLPGVALSLPQDAAGMPLRGAALLARQWGRQRLLEDALHGKEARSHVA
ncbi:ROK family transcriptional regulator [Deinococcus aestuarii]|uniref:ROK family transcriptional regulator n=1 Tax=Deinococcus aestuarii TaxID=2774531 RepID=UPI001C0A9E2B|nr:winged helix-turn-helix domain-containing protein [Deinococcus aestuarii]